MNRISSIVFGVTVALVGFPLRSDAVLWCNMDGAGGTEARKVQQRSARAAATFLQAASTTFQMLSHVELHLSGDQKAMATAADLSAQGMKQLDLAQKELKTIAQDSNSLRAANVQLKATTDFSAAFQQARVAPGSPVGTLVADARKKSAEELLQVCADTAAQLRSTETPMGRTYIAVNRREVPAAADLWAALAQWNEALIRGRLVAAMFGTLKK